ncbi:hypothetical protein ACWEWG_37950 [Streptomyces sp. NPDC003758]|uniref:Uncharacterized protein n=1 Tax=Streptomyces cynarae TaxID=2981134 RepID=A0ABY6ECD7_9ACTN|nr:hypothetical protein [Streptomyces cynarae]UXY24312.1 hypothetical protein N8I84_40880 [Streptomyces cynarae]
MTGSGHGSDEKVVIRLAEDGDGSERVLRVWERGQAVERGSDGGHPSGS